MTISKRFSISTCILLCLTFNLVSCGEDRTYEYLEKTQHNTWAYEVMTDKYLWAEKITETPESGKFFQKPTAFLSMLAKNGENDKFSHCIVDTIPFDDPHERGYFNHIKSYGLDVVGMTDPTGATSKLYARIMTVYPNSPASEARLQRGEFIGLIDGYKLSNSNLARLKSGMAHELTVYSLFYNEQTGEFVFGDEHRVNLAASCYVEDVAYPVTNVFRFEDRTVGYVMCTRLTEGAWEADTTSTSYMDDLDAIMTEMRHSRIDELVLDLRLCNFGTMNMAQRLASYIVPTEFLDSTFCSVRWNPNYAGCNRTIGFDKHIAQHNLGVKKIYFITGAYTSGAAEWLIHSLSTLMGEEHVFIVGEKTVGQNVMTEYVGHQFGIRLYPVVAHIVDPHGETGWGAITPNDEQKEVSFVDLYPYGSLREPLLQIALSK